MSCMFPQFVYKLRLDYCCHYLSAHDLSLPPRRTSASGNCLTLITLLFDFAHYRKPSRLILRLYDFLTTRRTCIYLPLSEIPGPQQKAGAVHELKPLSIPPVTSGNLRDPVFMPGSLGLTRNTRHSYGSAGFPSIRLFADRHEPYICHVCEAGYSHCLVELAHLPRRYASGWPGEAPRGQGPFRGLGDDSLHLCVPPQFLIKDDSQELMGRCWLDVRAAEGESGPGLCLQLSGACWVLYSPARKIY